MQSSPPENRAKNVMTQAASSQRIGAVMSRTNSHDSTPKSARSHKVCLSLFSMRIGNNILHSLSRSIQKIIPYYNKWERKSIPPWLVE